MSAFHEHPWLSCTLAIPLSRLTAVASPSISNSSNPANQEASVKLRANRHPYEAASWPGPPECRNLAQKYLAGWSWEGPTGIAVFSSIVIE
jgi:hypothetical protein